MKEVRKMKIAFVFLVCLILNTSCHEISTGTQINKLGSPMPGAKDELHKETDVRLQFVANNSPFVYDFVFSEGKIIGVGTGVKNNAEGLFVLNERTKSWDNQRVDSASSGKCGSVNGITLENENVWIVCYPGFVMKKAKFEENWRTMARIPVVEATFIAFVNPKVGYVVFRAFNKRETGLRIFKTEDGGESWKEVYENIVAGNPFDLAVSDEKTVLLAMNDEYVLRTEDGGATWHQLELEPPEKSWRGLIG